MSFFFFVFSNRENFNSERDSNQKSKLVTSNGSKWFPEAHEETSIFEKSFPNDICLVERADQIRLVK